MTSYEAGSAFLSVLPDMSKFRRRLQSAMAGVRVELDIPVNLDLDKRGLAALREVARRLPAIVLDADSSAADREVAALRDRILRLSGQVVGVDVSGDEARREIDAIRGELERLGREAPEIGVRVDAAAAEATLAGVNREASHLDGRRVNMRLVVDAGQALASMASMALAVNAFANRDYSFSVNADVSGATFALAGLIAKVAALAGLAGIVGGFGGALAGLGAAGVVAGAGLGATILASLGVGKALTAMNAQQDSAAATARSSAKQQQSAAFAIASAQDGVRQATLQANRARQEGARSIADAEKNAARSVEQALKAQATAQRTLRQATADLEREQSALTDAWEQGRRSLQDLQAQVRGNSIDQRQASLDLRDALKDLEDARRTGDADKIERATIAYDRQLATVDELRTAGQRLSTDNAAAQAKGVAGTDQVVSANQRIADALQRQADATVSARDADKAVTQARLDGAESVARAQEQASQRIADADRAVAQAQRSLAQAMAQTGDAGAAAADKVTSAFADLSPAAARFALFLFGLKPLLQDLSGVAAEQFFPPLQRGMETLLTQAPLAKTVIGQLAGAMGTGLGGVLAQLASPFWTQFFTLIGNAGTTLIPRAFDSMMVLARAAAVVLQVFLPLAPAAFDLLDQVSGLVVILAPFIAQLLGGLIPAASMFLTALQPLGPVLAALQPILLVLGQAFSTVLMAVLQALAPILVALTPLIQYLAAALANSLVASIQTATPFLVGLATWLSNNPGLVLGVISVLGSLGAAFKPVLFILGLAVAALHNFLIIKLAQAALKAFGLEGTIVGKLLLRLLSPINLLKMALPLLGRAAAFLGRSLLGALGPVGWLITALSLLYSGNEQFRNAVNGVLQVLGQLVGQLVGSLMPAFQKILDAVLPLVDMFAATLTPVIALFAGILVDLINTVLPPLVAILSGVVIPIIAKLADIFATVLVWVITNVVVPAIQFLAWLITNVIGPAISWLWVNIVKPAFEAIGRLAVWLFTNVLKPEFDNFVWILENIVGPILLWLWRNIVEPAFRGIGATIKWVWENLIKPAWNALSSGIEGVGQAFERVSDRIGRAWDSIKEKARGPVQWVIDFVYNNGIRKLWDGVRGVFGGAPLPEVRLARGGLVPGQDLGYDYVPALLRGGEGVLVPEAVAMLGGAAALEELNRGAERQHFANGGVAGFSSSGSTTARTDRATGSAQATTVAGSFLSDIIADAVGSVRRLFAGATGDNNRTPGQGMWRDGVTQILPRVVDAVIGKAKEYAASAVAGGSFGGSPATPNGVGGLGPMAAAARAFVMRTFGITNIGGYANRNIAGTGVKSDHALGKAIDVMIPNYQSPASIALGNRVASHFVTNPRQFGTKYVIWRDQINSGNGWRPYGHPGGGRSDTLQHRDHVHVSVFDQGGLARGKGWMFKNTTADERVLPPRETEAYPTLTRLSQQIEAGRLTVPDGMSSRQRAAAIAGRGGDPGRAGDTFHITARDHHSEERIAAEVQRRRDFAARTR